MPITVNEGGVLYDLDSITTNENGVLYELDTVHSNEGGTIYEIYSSTPSVKSIDWYCRTIYVNQDLSKYGIVVSDDGLTISSISVGICVTPTANSLEDPTGSGHYLFGKVDIPSGTICEMTINSIHFAGGDTARELIVYASTTGNVSPSESDTKGSARVSFLANTVPITLSFKTTAYTRCLSIIGYGMTGGSTTEYYDIDALNATFRFKK